MMMMAMVRRELIGFMVGKAAGVSPCCFLYAWGDSGDLTRVLRCVPEL